MKFPSTPKLIETYLDGLDAAVDGRGWNQTHEKAKDRLFRLVNTSETLLRAAKMVIADYDNESIFRHPRNSASIKMLELAIKKVEVPS